MTPIAHVRSLAALHRHRPREAVRRHIASEMQLDVAEHGGAQLPLRRVQVRARQAEAERR